MTPEQEQLETEILAYVEGELPPDKAARLEVYLNNGDPKLAARVRGMMDDRQALRSTPRLRAPNDLSERIMERIERTSLLGASIDHQLITENRQWWQSRMAIAAGFLLILGVFGYFVADSVWPRHEETWTPLAKAPEISPLSPTHEADTFPSAELADAAPAIAPDVSKSIAMAAPALAPAAVAATEPQVSPSPLASAAAPAEQRVATSTPQSALAQTAEVPSAQAALDNLRAAPQPAENPLPLVVTLLARDTGDVERLKSTLTAFVVDGQSAGEKKTNGADTGAMTQMASKDVPPDMVASAEQTKRMTDAIAAGKPGSSYRMRLRPAQLESLTRQFPVASISRGPQAYLIQNDARLAQGNNADRTGLDAAANTSKEIGGAGNGNYRVAGNDRPDAAAQNQNSAAPSPAQAKAAPTAENVAASAPANAPGAAGAQAQGTFGRRGGGGGGMVFGGGGGRRNSNPTPEAPEANNRAAAPALAEPGQYKQAENNNDQKAPAAMTGSNAMRQSAQRELDMAQPWIDCIITLVPAPAAAPENTQQTK